MIICITHEHRLTVSVEFVGVHRPILTIIEHFMHSLFAKLFVIGHICVNFARM